MDLGPLQVGPAGLGSAGLGPILDAGPASGSAGAAADRAGRGAAVLAIVELHDVDGGADHLVPFAVPDGSAAAREARDGDGAWRALAVAIAGGRVMPTGAGGALVCRPGLALPSFAPDGAAEIAALSSVRSGPDQSNTSAVLGERLLLKAYRRLCSLGSTRTWS